MILNFCKTSHSVVTDYPKNEDDIKIEDGSKIEDDPKNEDDPKMKTTTKMNMTPVLQCLCLLYYSVSVSCITLSLSPVL